MLIKSNSDELNKTGQNVLKINESLTTNLTKLEGIPARINECWIGTDSTLLQGKLTALSKNLRQLDKNAANLGNTLVKCSNNYIELDENFAQNLKKEESNYA